MTTLDVKRLRELSDGIDRSLKKDWSNLQRLFAEKKGEGVQLRSRQLIADLRAGAVLAFVLDADRSAFFKASYQAGLVYEYCNRLIKAGMPHESNLYTITRPRGLFDAFLTFQWPDVLRMLSTAPDEMQDEDDAVLFLFHTFLAEFIEGKRAGYEQTLESLQDEAAEGEDAGIEIALCEALRDRNKANFLEALLAYVNRRQDQVKARDNVLLGEEYISIEGLALRRIAAHSGIDVEVRHQMTPLELQDKDPALPVLTSDEVPNVDPATSDASYWMDWREATPW